MSRIIELLERIAVALEVGNTGHDPADNKAQLAYLDKALALQQRQVDLYDEHVRLHREFGLPPVEPRSGPLQ